MKLCLFCEHCCWVGPVWHSTLTGGDDGRLDCRKNHAVYWSEQDSLDELRGTVRQAETCPDYKQVSL